MPSRTHELKIGVGKHRQTGTGVDGTTSAQLQTALAAGSLVSPLINAFNTPVPQFRKEDNAAFYGKGHEWVTQVFPTSIDAPWEWPTPFLSSQAWAIVTTFALGKTTKTTPASGAYKYVSSPMYPPDDGVNLPATTIVAGIRQGTAGEMLDQALAGMVCTGFTLKLQRGPGLQNSSLISRWLGCGKYVANSGLAIPTALVETRLGAGAATTLLFNGVDFLANSQFVDVEFTYDNGVIPDSGYFPGSGSQGGFDIRGRMRYGDRKVGLVWTAELESTSAQLSDLLAATQGSVHIVVTGDLIAGGVHHSAEIVIPLCEQKNINYGEADGFTTIRSETDIKYGASLGPVFLTAVTNIDQICEAP